MGCVYKWIHTHWVVSHHRSIPIGLYHTIDPYSMGCITPWIHTHWMVLKWNYLSPGRTPPQPSHSPAILPSISQGKNTQPSLNALSKSTPSWIRRKSTSPSKQKARPLSRRWVNHLPCSHFKSVDEKTLRLGVSTFFDMVQVVLRGLSEFGDDSSVS